MYDTTTEQPVISGRRLADRRRLFRRASIGGGLAGLTMIVAACALGGATTTSPSAGSVPPTAPGSTPPIVTVGGADAPDSSPVGGESTAADPLPAADDSAAAPFSGTPGPAPSNPSEPSPVELDPVEPPPADPCDARPDGAALLVGPDPLVLPPDQMEGTLTITNCGDTDVAWTSLSKPSIALSSAGDQLAAGATADLGFVIDDTAWDAGAIDFKIKITEPDTSQYVVVHAYDTLFGIEAMAGNGTLVLGSSPSGCAVQCITSATLTPNLSTPNVQLDVGTNTPATIRAYVSTTEPVAIDGVPIGLDPVATSDEGRIAWSTTLAPLQPATEYHLVVTATDADGQVSVRSTTFHTRSSLTVPSTFAPGPDSCAVQCISSALVVPDTRGGNLTVSTDTPARFQVSIGVETPIEGPNGPSIQNSSFWSNSGEQYDDTWQVTLADLEPDTAYHIVVKATDADGHSAHRVGEFRTASEPVVGTVVTLHRIDVSWDGDSPKANRGEVTFAWRVGNDTVARWAERKIRDGESFVPARDNLWTVYGPDFSSLPVFVNAAERDPDGKVEACTHGNGAHADPARIPSCDTVVNVAATGILTGGVVASMPTCADLGLPAVTDEERCLWIESTVGEGYGTEFRALLSFRPAA